MKNLNLKKLLAAVAIVVVAGGIGVQKASALEIDESLNPIITSRTVEMKEADKNRIELPEEVKNDNINMVAKEDVMSPIITSRDFVKEEVKNDSVNKVAEEDVMNPIITSRDFVKSETKMDIRSTASIDDVMNPIITSETILSHK